MWYNTGNILNVTELFTIVNFMLCEFCFDKSYYKSFIHFFKAKHKVILVYHI